MDVGNIVRNERRKKNFKQHELASKVGISNTYLSDIEIGRTTPSLKTLIKIAEALEVEYYTLLAIKERKD